MRKTRSEATALASHRLDSSAIRKLLDHIYLNEHQNMKLMNSWPLLKKRADKGLLGLLTAVLAACADYPANGNRTELNDTTSIEKTLEVMNELGKEYYVETHRHFEMGEGCQLKVRTGSLINRKTDVFPLQVLQARIDTSEDKRTYRVMLSEDKEAEGKVTILENAPFFDAHQMSWLVQHAHALCRK